MCIPSLKRAPDQIRYGSAVTLPPPSRKLALKLYCLPLVQLKQIKSHPFVTDQSPHLYPNLIRLILNR
jgi:hypothetical protein